MQLCVVCRSWCTTLLRGRYPAPASTAVEAWWGHRAATGDSIVFCSTEVEPQSIAEAFDAASPKPSVKSDSQYRPLLHGTLLVSITLVVHASRSEEVQTCGRW